MKLFKKGLFSNTLNIIGLSIALTAFIIIVVQVNYDLSFNKNIPDYQDIYRMEYASDNINIEDDDINNLSYNEYSTYFSVPMIDQMVVSSANIGSYFAVYNLEKNRQVKKEKDETTVSSVYLSTDIGFIDIMRPDILYGNANNLTKDGIIISQRLANKLFGKGNPCGQILSNKNGNWNKKISGIYKKFPKNSSFRGCDIIEINKNIDHNDTGEWSYQLYLKLKPNSDPALTEENMLRKILQSEESSLDSIKLSKYINAKFLRLSNIHDTHFSQDIRYDNTPKANKHTIYSLITIAILILLIAIINFINFSLASVPTRIKSINTRKILGSSVSKLRGGIILNAVCLSLISFIISIVLILLLQD
ncbi:MAG: ABC transporter permease, partial [Bacilli bacterium]